MPSYHPKSIEPRWQAHWQRYDCFYTSADPAKPTYYILDMFPYPSGAGLHVGHPEGYTATDILARYKRMCGFAVLHPMGWDAFGLPAEQYAILTGKHPRLTTQKNIAEFKRQIQSLGFSYDWNREVDTTDPAYVKWTQWIFLLLYDTWYDHAANGGKGQGRPISELPIPPAVAAAGDAAVRDYRDSRRLAYQAESPVNWCPALGTVLANEEVIDGKSERGDFPVVRLPLKQWLLRITAYADRLIDDLDGLDWSHSIKSMQREWIGRSEGAEVTFAIADHAASVTVFTTRPDTLFGATYMVLSPEHALVEHITTPAQRDAVTAYRTEAGRKSERERTDAKAKTGVATGAFAINPVNGERIPIWIADYVLAGYGTGAIMAVPAHDERDYAFATQFGLPIRLVVTPADGSAVPTDAAFCELGVAVNSGPYDGLPTAEVKARITADLTAKGIGRGRVNYKLRDWLFSRQRYWGEPFPLLHELDDIGEPTGTIRPLTLADLPLRLPDLEDYLPSGRPEPLLGKAAEWAHVTIDGVNYRRELNTMPQWAGSCWYYLRYLDPHNDGQFCAPEVAARWLPVDLYVGGAEHAVLHLLYARFWHKVLFDRGHVPCAEPFQKLVNQGMILGEVQYHVKDADYPAYADTLAARQLSVLLVEQKDAPPIHVLPDVGDEEIEKKKGQTLLKGTTVPLTGRAEKMSKSRGNVINPDDVVSRYGADSLRLYEMFMGPLEAVKPWSMQGVEGVYRFLSRVWRLTIDDRSETTVLHPQVQDVPPDRDTLRLLHRTIQRVTDDLDGMRFNTAIAAMMEYTNHLAKVEPRPRSAVEPFVLLLAPFAPHIAEEIWHTLGHADSLTHEPWPKYDPELVRAEEIEVPVQVNGKLRGKVTLPAGTSEDAIKAAALADDKVQAAIAGKEIVKVIVPGGRLVNIVVKG